MNRQVLRVRRRQALKVLAAAAVVPFGVLALGKATASPGMQTWRGESLGGPASLTLWHPDPGFAQSTIVRMRTEIERLESVFSLFRTNSEIVQLNRDGRLNASSPDLRLVLEAAQAIASASGGAFDPTVQPLWHLYEQFFRAHPESTVGPSLEDVARARTLVDYQKLEVGAKTVRFHATGMAITLNGIAQGYITDRVADLLREEGFEHAMVDVGETRAIGAPPDHYAWTVAIKSPTNPSAVDRRVNLRDAALSISGGYGTRFGKSPLHHIFEPETGRSAQHLADAVVVAPRAMIADALSTAIYVAGEVEGAGLLSKFPGTRAYVSKHDGSYVALTGKSLNAAA